MNTFGKNCLLRISIGTALTLGVSGVGTQILAQTPAVPANGRTQQRLPHQGNNITPPTEILYYHLFMLQAHFEEIAAQRGLANGQGQAVRTHLQSKIGLSDSDFALFETSSLHLSGIVKDLKQQAQTVAESDHALKRSGALANGATPPGLPQLKKLEHQRRIAIKEEITDLESRISPDGKDLLHTYLQGTVAASTTLTPVTPSDIQAARAARKGKTQ